MTFDVLDILKFLGGAGLVALIGIIIKGFFDERSSIMGNLLDDVKSLRADSLEQDKQLQVMNDRLQGAQTALLECMTGRAELTRQLANQQTRIAELEALVKRHAGLDAP